ncbi:SDR family oxidoreductase [Asanoa iriomotensis]|uniref:Oxidoreductase n=1 Tax=Asanoa iriomotensis TaxID=234613 RepID=A0ABQ4CBU1_9ACTN|nr:SDR family oxidoreductase [Asanoa iriomotensis]GIF60242.1 oxidoreductase [Asanoa iriomotensis]
MDLGLADRVYVLTGATRGLGFATARYLVDEGARVIVSSRHQEHVDAAVAELGGLGKVQGIVADLTAPDTAARLVALAQSSFGRLDGALLSVGGPPPGTALSVSDDDWRMSFETVFLGAVRTARVIAAALPSGGAIGLVLSSSARTPIDNLGISNGFRPGLVGVAKDMADELGPRGVRVVSLLPGRFLTDRTRAAYGDPADPTRPRAGAGDDIPLRRVGDAREFGRAAAFVLSPAASYVTGTSIAIDGGLIRAL